MNYGGEIISTRVSALARGSSRHLHQFIKLGSSAVEPWVVGSNPTLAHNLTGRVSDNRDALADSPFTTLGLWFKVWPLPAWRKRATQVSLIQLTQHAWEEFRIRVRGFSQHSLTGRQWAPCPVAGRLKHLPAPSRGTTFCHMQCNRISRAVFDREGAPSSPY